MGHTLFALLARISLDVVRVDLSVLAVRDDTGRALQVLTSVARTATEFGLTAIAGGISTPQLRASALAAGVDLVHGRSQPHELTAAALADLLAVPAG
jgi:EAL domain-containing protein (putative c-di-GMP-specific phosphodiesterase class I)